MTKYLPQTLQVAVLGISYRFLDFAFVLFSGLSSSAMSPDMWSGFSMFYTVFVSIFLSHCSCEHSANKSARRNKMSEAATRGAA